MIAFHLAFVLPYSPETIEWGDILQVLEDGTLKHSAFYLGEGKYLHKTGGSYHSINVVSFETIRELYLKDSETYSFRLIRRKDRDSLFDPVFKLVYSK